MTHKEEQYFLDTLEKIRDETHENNIMLKQIIRFINTSIAHYNQENVKDFNMNVIANTISNCIRF